MGEVRGEGGGGVEGLLSVINISKNKNVGDKQETNWLFRLGGA